MANTGRTPRALLPRKTRPFCQVDCRINLPLIFGKRQYFRVTQKLLCRSFGARRVAGFCPCSPLAKTDASFEASPCVLRGKRTRDVLPVFAMRRTKYSDKQRIFYFLLCCFHNFRNFVSAKPAHRGRAGHKKLYGIPAFSSNLSVNDGAIEESLPPRRRPVEAGERRLRTLSSVFSNFAT